MNTVAFVVIGSLALVTLAVVGWFLTTGHVPEQASEHESSETLTTTDRLGKNAFGPADPGAEVMDPELLGGDESPPT